MSLSKMVSNVTKVVSVALSVLLLSAIGPTTAQGAESFQDLIGSDGILDTYYVDFNDTTDLTNFFNTNESSPVFTNIGSTGINNSGVVNVPLGSNEIWTTKQGYSVSGIGDKYTFSSYFKIAANSGRGGLGFSETSPGSGGIFSTPSVGIGATYHGGGGEFINNGSVLQNLSWPPDLIIGNWYYMVFIIEASAADTYDLTLQIWETDASGSLGAMKTEKTYAGLVNTQMGAASTFHGFFSAAGNRMERMDNYKITLEGGAGFVEEGNPVVVPAAPIGSITDTSAVTGGEVTDDQGTSVTARGVCYSISPNPTIADSCTNDGSGTGTYTSTLTGLAPGTTYYAVPYATNGSGTSYGPTETFTTTGTAAGDSDGIADSIEAAAPNSGDANNDGNADNQQDNVTSLLSSVSGNYVTIAAGGVCSTNSGVAVEQETTVETKDDDSYDYPIGLLDFSLTGCVIGGTETITQYYYGNLNAAELVLRKYDRATDTYSTIDSAVISPVNIGGQDAVRAVYQITDGGALDADGIANGTIVDPVGLGLEVSAAAAPVTGVDDDTEILAETGGDSRLLPIVGILLVAATTYLLFMTRNNKPDQHPERS